MYVGEHTFRFTDGAAANAASNDAALVERLNPAGSDVSKGLSGKDGIRKVGSQIEAKGQPVILVALDLSRDSFETLQTGLDIAQQAGGELVLLHAVHLNLTPYGPANVASLTHKLREEAMAQLKALWLRAQAPNILATCLVESGAAAKIILETARRSEADLIVLGAREQSFIRRWFGRHV